MKAERVPRRQFEEAHKFFRDKLDVVPEMPKYNVCIAALYDAAGRQVEADSHYKTALMCSPNNIMIRSDYALHLSAMGNSVQAKHELNKALLADPNQPTVHKNLGAVYARVGDYKQAQEHARIAYLNNPDDPMNHRNMARCLNIGGKTQAALDMNLSSIAMERASGAAINTSAFRSAAVQSISRGKPQEEALGYIRAARHYEGKCFVSDTTARSDALVRQVLARRGDRVGTAKGQSHVETAPVQEGAKKALMKYTKRLDALDSL